MLIEFKGDTYEISKIPQYEGIPYSAMLCCPECSEHRIFGLDDMASDKVVGYVETYNGELQIVKECKICGGKYRFHYYRKWKDGEFDVEGWKRNVGIHLSVDNQEHLMTRKGGEE